ncbi:MAG: transporter [Bacteroidetes bacterium]|nr:MAG: transporter [Bacteroidota bacterium]
MPRFEGKQRSRTVAAPLICAVFCVFYGVIAPFVPPKAPHMESLIALLAHNKLLLLFSVIGLGYLLGQIRIYGFSLGVAAVLFVGIAFGALDKRLVLPEEIYIVGLVLFVYSVGLQSGPSFFSSFNQKSLRINLFVIAALLISALVAGSFSLLFAMDAPHAAGLFCGALTNTPALAASVEAVKSFTLDHPEELRNQLVNAPVIAYSLAYPFGVLGVILWFYLFSRVFRVDFAREEADRLKESGVGSIQVRTYRVTNPAVTGKEAWDVLKLIEHRRFVLTRYKRGGEINIILPETVFRKDDLVVAVGAPDALEGAKVILGEESDEQLTLDTAGFEYRRMFVSSEETVGRPIHELHLEKKFSATITRVRRGDVDFVPSPDTRLELGDRVRVVTRHENIRAVTEFFGDSVKSISETDFLSISLGIVLGVFVGMMPIPLPNGSTFKLGFAGGPLVVSLILGRLQRTGSVTWTMPFNANLVLRQIGLVFFLAGIGIKAGDGFGATVRSGGLGFLAAGALITTVASLFTIVLGYKYLRLPMSAVMGVMSGVGTQPACLAYANQTAKNDQPNMHYAMVYPASMIAKIVLAQVLVSALWR